MEFLRSFHKFYFAEKPVVESQQVGRFLRLKIMRDHVTVSVKKCRPNRYIHGGLRLFSGQTWGSFPRVLQSSVETWNATQRQLTRLWMTFTVDDTRISRLTCAIPTFYDHFPKPWSWVWPTGFSRTGWRWCHSNLIGRRRRRRRELSPGKNARIRVFTCERAISYHSMNMTVMRSQRRSGNDMRFGPGGHSSRQRRLPFQRKLSSGFREFSLVLPVIWTQRQRVRIC